MYQALYRKWRPKSFDEVVGQDHITTTLKNEVALGKFSHAYLFTGSRGTGKTTCSKIVAKAVNCQNPQQGNPCNECEVCRGIDDGSILDVVEIDAASNNGVDNIRQLREEAYFLPSVAKYRVYILDECHMLSPGAVNALLKILEEPPAHVIFILATTEIHKVLPTILSRCQRFDFKRIKSCIIADRLLYVCEQEGLALTEDAALLIARLSDGGMRDALSLLDLCVSYSNEITAQTVVEAAGLTGQDHLFEMTQAMVAHQPANALAVVERLSENSVDFARLCEQLVGHYRNLMIVRTVKEPDELVQGTPEDLERLREQARQLSLAQILYALDVLQEAMGKISRTAFKRTEFEMAVIRLCDERMGEGLDGVFSRIERLEEQLRSGVVRPAAPSEQAKPETPIPASAPQQLQDVATTAFSEQPKQQPASGSEVVPFTQWAEVLQQLKRRNGALYGAMVESRAFTSGEMMLIDCANEMFRALLRTSVAAKESLRDSILAVTGQKFNLGPYNPKKHTIAQEEPQDPLSGMLKKARDLGVPVTEEG
ncbi:MAG: DNA polymerase III subunit gamma/tau [Anaerotruncus sp.]|nr:DNA polymerase III subunit gamma/tau [Anaerotruncus sp.]